MLPPAKMQHLLARNQQSQHLLGDFWKGHNIRDLQSPYFSCDIFNAQVNMASKDKLSLMKKRRSTVSKQNVEENKLQQSPKAPKKTDKSPPTVSVKTCYYLTQSNTFPIYIYVIDIAFPCCKCSISGLSIE